MVWTVFSFEILNASNTLMYFPAFCLIHLRLEISKKKENLTLSYNMSFVLYFIVRIMIKKSEFTNLPIQY